MGQPFIGEIRMFAGNFAPVGWALCNGQMLSIAQYQALFAVIGTFYGGNGTTTFALPNYQGTVPLSQGQKPGGSNYVIGQAAGTENVTLLSGQMPVHTHTVQANANSTGGNVSGSVLASFSPAHGQQTDPGTVYAAAPDGSTTMNASMVANTGSDLPHNNQQPYLAVTFIIALNGVFPSRG